MQVRHVVKLDSDVHGYLLVLVYLIKMQVRHVVKLDSDVHG